MDTIRVISGDKDGADLRRDQFQHPWHIRCDGKKDNERIQEAIDTGGHLFLGLGDAWERIFGAK